jgi:hypothetical protein
MQQAIVRVFDVFERAEQARDALLGDGLGREAVSLSVRDDEAGPVEGNFTVGNLPVQSEQHTYDRNYSNATQRGHCMITVQAADADTAARAVAILERCGGRDPNLRR